MQETLKLIDTEKCKSFDQLLKLLPKKPKRSNWINAGGQLIEEAKFDQLKQKICNDKIKSWDAVHTFYTTEGAAYAHNKLAHALASLVEVTGSKQFSKELFKTSLQQYLSVKIGMVKGIYDSRAKDYTNPFRKMMYETEAEMDIVTGKLDENSFILQQQEELKTTKAKVQKILKGFNL